LPGQITGQVSQDVYDTVTGKYLLIPQGTKLVGEYNSTITYGQERVQIIWTRVLRPDGSSISLEGMPGVDMSGDAGLSEKVNNHWMKLLGGVVISSVLGAGGQIAQGGTSQLNPSFGQLAAQGTGANLNDVGQQLTRKNLNLQPTLEISPGGRFNVFVNHDVELTPYSIN
jgi:type IV secretion system protein VirB10